MNVRKLDSSHVLTSGCIWQRKQTCSETGSISRTKKLGNTCTADSTGTTYVKVTRTIVMREPRRYVLDGFWTSPAMQPRESQPVYDHIMVEINSPQSGSDIVSTKWTPFPPQIILLASHRNTRGALTGGSRKTHTHPKPYTFQKKYMKKGTMTRVVMKARNAVTTSIPRRLAMKQSNTTPQRRK
jgi:hypothetical protein